MGEETSVVTIGAAVVVALEVEEEEEESEEEVEEEAEEEEVDEEEKEAEEAEEEVDARRGSSAVLVTLPSPAPISKIVFGHQLFFCPEAFKSERIA